MFSPEISVETNKHDGMPLSDSWNRKQFCSLQNSSCDCQVQLTLKIRLSTRKIHSLHAAHIKVCRISASVSAVHGRGSVNSFPCDAVLTLVCLCLNQRREQSIRLAWSRRRSCEVNQRTNTIMMAAVMRSLPRLAAECSNPTKDCCCCAPTLSRFSKLSI
jgi:hypothetical protein